MHIFLFVTQYNSINFVTFQKTASRLRESVMSLRQRSVPLLVDIIMHLLHVCVVGCDLDNGNPIIPIHTWYRGVHLHVHLSLVQ